MGDHSQDEKALMKIQHEWAEARVKGDSSYTRTDTFVNQGDQWKVIASQITPVLEK
jgi:hypothetical protein